MKLHPAEHVGLWRSLGARFHGMEEVVGSIPTRSTNILFQISNLDAYTPAWYRPNLVSFGVKSSDLFFDSFLVARSACFFDLQVARFRPFPEVRLFLSWWLMELSVDATPSGITCMY